MSKYILSAYIGNDDQKNIRTANPGEIVGSFNLQNSSGKFNSGIDSAIAGLGHLDLASTETGLDLLFLGVLVQAADTRLNRKATAEDAWCREIVIEMPVSDVNKWNGARENLQKMLRFLTGDRWLLSFRQRIKEQNTLIEAPTKISSFDFDEVCLFSGGVDSLVGAIDAISSGKKSLFASHGGEAAVSAPQQKVFEAMSTHFKSKNLQRVRLASGQFPKNIFPGIRGENSTRGRSFLFFALGCFAGASLQKPFGLRIPENGLIALNVPLDPTRLGASSTRTTHPYYIHRWNQLLRDLQIPGTCFNPFWNKTKGEMIKECADQSFLKSVMPNTISCAHPSQSRFLGFPIGTQCGTCLPCIIRRAAIEYAWGSAGDKTSYVLPNLKLNPLDAESREGEQVRGFEYAIKHLNANPKSANTLVFKQGPLKEDHDKIADLASVYSRGLGEVEAFLKGVITK